MPKKMSIEELFQSVKLVVADVDGTMTDGRRYYGPSGEALKVFNVRDGMGIRLLRAAGVDFLMMTGSRCPATQARADELNVPCLEGVMDKKIAIADWASRRGLQAKEIIFVGDDLNDLPAARVSVLVAVADAANEVIDDAFLVLSAAGGQGAIREIADLVIEWRGLDAPTLAAQRFEQ